MTQIFLLDAVNRESGGNHSTVASHCALSLFSSAPTILNRWISCYFFSKSVILTLASFCTCAKVVDHTLRSLFCAPTLSILTYRFLTMATISGGPLASEDCFLSISKYMLLFYVR